LPINIAIQSDTITFGLCSLPATFFPLHLDWRSALGRVIRVKAAYPHRFFVLAKSAWP
jgi:hypothetical protein